MRHLRGTARLPMQVRTLTGRRITDVGVASLIFPDRGMQVPPPRFDNFCPVPWDIPGWRFQNHKPVRGLSKRRLMPRTCW